MGDRNKKSISGQERKERIDMLATCNVKFQW
jgi:hypothetical protein